MMKVDLKCYIRFDNLHRISIINYDLIVENAKHSTVGNGYIILETFNLTSNVT